MGELLELFQVLQGLDAEKAAEAREARVAQALQEYTRQVAEHTGILTQHASVINARAAELQSVAQVTDNHAAAIEHIQEHLGRTSLAHVAEFGLLAALWVLVIWLVVMHRRVERRVKDLESR